MPYDTEFVDSGRGVVHAGSGVVTGKEILEGTIFGFKAVQDGMPIRHAIIDFTNATEFRVTTDDLKEIVATDKKFASMVPKAYVALVAPENLIFSMSLLWEISVQNPAWETYIFRTRAEADSWLQEKLAGKKPSGK